jgi:hypothetical protein
MLASLALCVLLGTRAAFGNPLTRMYVVFSEARSHDAHADLIRVCGTAISDEEVTAREKHFEESKVTPSEGAIGTLKVCVYRTTSSPRAALNIFCIGQVYFHVVSNDATLEGGNVP